MNNKELRIGNYVLADYDEVEVIEVYQEQIKARKLYSLEGLDDIVIIHLQNVHPIPLTADLLVMCGFELMPDGAYSFGNIPIFPDSVGYYFKCAESADRILIKNFTYLHQLQNLFYILGTSLPDKILGQD